MAAPVEIQLRNAQSSVLFMQQEHAQTLQGLHRELQKLQKKCAELTFELAMKEGSPDEEHYIKQVKVLETEIRENKAKREKLEIEVDKKERRTAILEQQLKVQEKKYLDEIKKQKQISNRYKTDLEKKSEMIAHLTTQIHQYNLNKHKRSVSLDEDLQRTASPQPPSEPRPNFRRPHKLIRSPEEGAVRKGHRPMRAIPVDGIPHEGLTLSEFRQEGAVRKGQHPMRAIPVNGIPHEGLTLSEFRHQYSRTRSKETQSDPLNVSAFLVQSEPKNSLEVEVKAAPPVLPPIHSRRGTRSPLNNAHHPSPAILAKNETSRLSKKDLKSPEKQTLVVKKVFSNEKKLYQVEES